MRQVALPKGLVPISPTFSRDGRWFAFVTGSTALMHGSLWIAHADGAGAHRVAGLVLGDAFGWSPHSDLYAVAAGPLSTRVPFGQPTTVRLVSPSGTSRTLATTTAVVGAGRSPDGASLAVSTLSHSFVPSLNSYTIHGDRRTTWNDDPNSRQYFVVPAGWWNGWGVVYTVIDNGAVPNGEGSFEDAALYSLAGPDATPHFLGETLTNDSAGPPSATNTGLLTFVSDAGQDPRTPWNGKQVEVCSPASLSCSAVPAPSGDVTEDPAWSPSGSMLAYVASPSRTPTSSWPLLSRRGTGHTCSRCTTPALTRHRQSKLRKAPPSQAGQRAERVSSMKRTTVCGFFRIRHFGHWKSRVHSSPRRRAH